MEVIDRGRVNSISDDLVTGERGVEECLSLYQKSKKCLLEGGVNLQKWISNSPKLLELICEDQVGTVGTCAVSDALHVFSGSSLVSRHNSASSVSKSSSKDQI